MLLPRIPLNLLKQAYNQFFERVGWPYAAGEVRTSQSPMDINKVLDTYKMFGFKPQDTIVPSDLFGRLGDTPERRLISQKTFQNNPDMSLIAREPLPQFSGQGSYEPSWQERESPTLGFLKYLANKGEFTESPTETHIFDLPRWWDYKQKPIQDYRFNQYLIDTNRPELTQYYRHSFDTPDPSSAEEMMKSIYENNRSLLDSPIKSQQGSILEFIRYLAQKGLLNESL